MEKIEETIYDFFDRNLYKRKDLLATDRDVLKSPNLAITQGVNIDPAVGISTIPYNTQAQISYIGDQVTNIYTALNGIAVSIVSGSLISSGFNVYPGSTYSSSVWLGYQSSNVPLNLSSTVSIGANASLSYAGTSNCVFIGNYAGLDSKLGSSVIIGVRAGSGWTSGLIATGAWVVIGHYAGYNDSFISATWSNFVAIGYYAGYNGGGTYSTFVGDSAGAQSIVVRGTFIGAVAGLQCTGATDSLFVGFYAGGSSSSLQFTIAIGNQAAYNADIATDSIFIGTLSGTATLRAHNSIFIGKYSGHTDTVNNTTAYDYSILIGHYTRTGGFNRSILLGSSITGAYIANTMVDQFMLAPNIINFRARGVDYVLPAAQGGAGTVLTNDGAGNLSWV